jgi:autotransporter-associated beta strand protein
MRLSLFCVLFAAFPAIAAAQTSVNFSIDTQQSVKPISRYIYGVNQSLSGNYSNLTLTRLGGNRWTAYNWETNASNAGSDWNFQNDSYLGGGNAPGGAVAPSIQNASDRNAGILLTIPTVGYVAADKLGNGDVRYVNGGSTPDPNYLQTRFKQSLPSKGSAFSNPPNASDAYVYQDEFVNWLKTTYPYCETDPNRPIFFSLDNEPDLWSSTHAEVHPNAATYAEMVQKSVAYGTAIKNVMPGAKVFGPVNYGWYGMLTLQDAPDAAGRDFLNYYLAQMKQAEQTAGKRLLDVLDVHWYPEATGKNASGNDTRIVGDDTSPGVVAARLQAPRSLWDSTYTETSWITQWSTYGPIDLLHRVQNKIDANYAGTKLSISEYNYGGGNHISGGIAQADVLGIYGREGVFSANEWPMSSNESFIAGGFLMYRNFDGKNGTFGDTSISAQTNDNAASSIYASLDSQNPNRMVLVALNKTDHAISAAMNLQHASAFGLADIYRLTSASAAPTYVDSVLIANPASFNYSMPSYSVSTLLVRPGSGLKRELSWNQTGATWNTATAANRPWQTDGHTAFFLAGDRVTFTTAKAGNVAIDSAGVSPDAVFVQNASGNYTFAGGPIAGSAMLEKSGAGTLTLSNANTYAGKTSILGGVLALDAQGQIDPASLVENQATLKILAGSHQMGTIRGAGTTQVLAGSLTADSIVQDSLVIGSGGMMSAASEGENPAVPEPSMLLLLAIASSLFGLSIFCSSARPNGNRVR